MFRFVGTNLQTDDAKERSWRLSSRIAAPSCCLALSIHVYTKSCLFWCREYQDCLCNKSPQTEHDRLEAKLSKTVSHLSRLHSIREKIIREGIEVGLTCSRVSLGASRTLKSHTAMMYGIPTAWRRKGKFSANNIVLCTALHSCSMALNESHRCNLPSRSGIARMCGMSAADERKNRCIQTIDCALQNRSFVC